ncbi:hypothetical protein OC846_003675 [Tilletia horrida]|uniref:Alpha N-terminal protein methyltransferase 1 n=1 Tax=Tilletia horrida TaxID=155126 RepID=A0AAN6GP21_9BASI|nr:hypothetical protein OC846_003675 [Tilletia horrida]KAK0565548.1 hypothetical protein OC861_003710 [Tilletia horrida]
MQISHAQPHLERGLQYWEGVEATVNGVLGGYGLGTLPVVDSLGTRTFILNLLAHLVLTPPATVADPAAWLKERAAARAKLRSTESGGLGPLGRTRALDVGAGVGRVSRDTLLPLVEEVHLVEPVRKFLDEAKKTSASWSELSYTDPDSATQTAKKSKGKKNEESGRKEFRDLIRASHGRKLAYFWENTMQDFDPSFPRSRSGASPIPPTLSPEESAIAEFKTSLETQANESETSTNDGPLTRQQTKRRRTGSGSGPSLSIRAPARKSLDGVSMELSHISADLGLQLDSQAVKYDVILIQWCAQHLKDTEMVAFLHRCQKALKSRVEMLGEPGTALNPPILENDQKALADPGLGGGIVVIKENVCTEDEDGNERVVWDDEDHSITRSRKAYERLFKEAGMEIVKSEVQLGLPAELFEVRQWALR